MGPGQRRDHGERRDGPGHPAEGVRPDRSPRRPTRPRRDRPRGRPVRDVVAAAGHRPGRRPPPRLRPHRLPAREAAQVSSWPATVAAAPRTARTGPSPGFQMDHALESPRARAMPTTAADCTRPVTSSRSPGSPTYSTPGPTGPAPGSPPGARPSTSRPGPSSRSTPTHRRRNRNHRHPTTRRLSDSGPSGIGIGTRRGLGHGAPGAAEDWHRIRRSPSG